MSNENEHLETFKAIANGKGWATTTKITDTEWTLQTDEPIDDGGTNTGANPMQYFSAALTGCQNEQAQVVAEELSLSISGIDIDLEIDLDLGGFMGEAENSEGSYKQVRLNATVKGDLTNDQVQELGKKVDARCPILGLLRSSNCEINSNWKLA